MNAGELAMMIPLVAIIGCIFLASLRIWKGDGRQRSMSDPNETKLIQDIYHGLIKMEERVEALETLLLDREQKGGVK